MNWKKNKNPIFLWIIIESKMLSKLDQNTTIYHKNKSTVGTPDVESIGIHPMPKNSRNNLRSIPH